MISKPPTWWKDYVPPKPRKDQQIANFADQCVNAEFHCFLSTLTEHDDPEHFKHVVSQEHWVAAMNLELEQCEKNAKKQTVVAKSTAEAKIRAMSLTACEVIWLKYMLKDLGISHLTPTLLKCDNQPTIAIAANPVLHERTKHVGIDCHYVRDMVNNVTLVTEHVPSKDQLADILTKILSVKQHNELLLKLGVQSAPHTQLEGGGGMFSYRWNNVFYAMIGLVSYELEMDADEVPGVGGHETRKVSISFSRLLQQVVEYLKLPVPTDYLVDVRKNSVKVVMETDLDLGPSVYEGGPAATVTKSREKAAENAMNRIELEEKERGAKQVPVKRPTVPDHKRRKKYVCIDYMDVLHTLYSETKVRISQVDTFNVGPGKFVSWVTIYGSSIATRVECFLIDLNYGNGIYAGIKCSLARESYLAAKERVLEIQGALHLAPFLVEEGCVTPKSAVHRIPTPTPPQPPPHKPRARLSFSARYSGQPSPVPAELDSFFKRRKFE
uniref:Uncharacterized protein n=1 Tax=Chenopodium quinoa TaxID=63459 RepID=A0A803MUI3_CHEQI